MMSLPLIAISTLISSLIAPSAKAPAPADNGQITQATPLQEADRDDAQLPPQIDVVELGFADGISRAERLNKMMVVLWTGSSGNRDAIMTETILGDPEVRRWISEHAIIIRIDRNKNSDDARKNRVGVMQVPSIDIYSVRRALRLERLTFGTGSLDFLAAVLGQTDGEIIVRPEGDAENEPFKWLAWANVRNRDSDSRALEDALFAYQWCLQTADAIRPGFRARFLEYLLRRITGLKNRTPGAKPALEQERSRLKRRILKGMASRRDVYEYTRVFDWLSQEEHILTVFEELDSSIKEQRQYQLWLLPTAAPILGRYSRFESLLGAVGNDATDIFMARYRTLESETARVNAQPSMEAAPADDGREKAKATAQGTADPKGLRQEISEAVPIPKGPYDEDPLPHSLSDNRSNLIEDASWIFEALLSADRDDEAKALQAAVAKCYPTAPRAYALFVERALRAKKWGIAADIADVGIANVGEKAQKRLQRLQSKLAELAAK